MALRRRLPQSGRAARVDALRAMHVHGRNLGRIERQVTRRGGAAQPVVDRFAEPVMRDRLDGDRRRAAAVERLEHARRDWPPPRADRPLGDRLSIATACSAPSIAARPEGEQRLAGRTSRASSRTAAPGA